MPTEAQLDAIRRSALRWRKRASIPGGRTRTTPYGPGLRRDALAHVQLCTLAGLSVADAATHPELGLGIGVDSLRRWLRAAGVTTDGKASGKRPAPPPSKPARALAGCMRWIDKLEEDRDRKWVVVALFNRFMGDEPEQRERPAAAELHRPPGVITDATAVWRGAQLMSTLRSADADPERPGKAQRWIATVVPRSDGTAKPVCDGICSRDGGACPEVMRCWDDLDDPHAPDSEAHP